ncbi:iron complex transport system ATP-binding protein [Rhodobacter aestuarii]|uniref:Iron complex transport system ATP-binding protein n=1 Tax=Rhodobacter aestuarii TaxID=453582 RepID=A0A1N7JKT4_9RHOB|nr:heme ABC transporter ATP-binding protein [Rhodobacter aestuarii]PTV96097.1 iron complex transport system ATP-binding protein [Rhodobacter aestuarii]SIS49925.1 iron complex transport system ATP-binding protein [Rhodobacter aestuarii]
MLEAEQLGATLGGRAVLQAVHLRARPGEITAIVGPNGSGKTTLLRRLTGDLAGAGVVRLEGVSLTTLSARALARRRAVLPQSVSVGFPFTLREVVAMGHASGNAAHLPGVVEAALEEVGLADKIDGFFHDMSGGEQARGHLARVRAQVWAPVYEGRPAWLFVDEPVAALDIGHQLQVMAVLRRFADAGGGVIAVMHDLNLTAMHAEQMVLMEAGKISAAGSPAEVMTAPLLSRAYRCQLCMNTAPKDGVWLLPQVATML